MSEEYDQRRVRREYGSVPLRRSSLAADPVDQFARWFRVVTDSGLLDATAMALATTGQDGAPSVRIVLLKHFDAQGFCWYTDYRSRKGGELALNAQASLLFYWRDFNRQVRISGSVERLSAELSDEYFHNRPAPSRFAAAASVQTAPVDNREALEAAVAKLRARHPDGIPPRPDDWGGYRLRPAEFEFWQGRDGRLHDRFQYKRTGGGEWRAQRLQP